MALFGPKPWINPFSKNLNFSTFQTFFLYTGKEFFVLKYRKTYFFPILPKKKVGKMAIWGQKRGSIRLEKSQFLDFFNFLFL